MKKIVFILMVFSLLFSACTKTNSIEVNKSTPTYAMTATLENTPTPVEVSIGNWQGKFSNQNIVVSFDKKCNSTSTCGYISFPDIPCQVEYYLGNRTITGYELKKVNPVGSCPSTDNSDFFDFNADGSLTYHTEGQEKVNLQKVADFAPQAQEINIKNYKSLKLTNEFGSNVYSSALFSQNENPILAIMGSKSIFLYDSSGQKLLHELKNPYGPIWNMAISPDGKYVAALTFLGDNNVTVWQTSDAKEVFSIKPTGIANPEISMSSNYLLAVGNELYNLYTGKKVKSFPYQLGMISANGSLVIEKKQIGTQTFEYFIIDVLAEKGVFTPEENPSIVMFSADSKRLMTVDNFPIRTVRIYDTKTFEKIDQIKLSEGVVDVDVNFDGTKIAIAKTDNEVQIYDFSKKMITSQLVGQKNWDTASFSPDSAIIALHHDDLIELTHFDEPDTPTTLKLGSMWKEFVIIPGKDQIAIATKSGFEIWDLISGNLYFQQQLNQPALSIGISTDAKTLGVGLENGEVSLWSIPERSLIGSFEASRLPITKLLFIDDYQFVTTDKESAMISIWNSETQELISTLTHPAGWIADIGYASDSGFLFSSSSIVAKWDIQTGEQLQMWTIEGDALISTLFVSNDGNRWEGCGTKFIDHSPFSMYAFFNGTEIIYPDEYCRDIAFEPNEQLVILTKGELEFFDGESHDYLPISLPSSPFTIPLFTTDSKTLVLIDRSLQTIQTYKVIK